MASVGDFLTPFDRFKKMSFGPNVFPYKSYKVKGAQRKHVHEYPRNDYSAVEKLGRSLYEVTVVADFQGDLDTPGFQGTKDLLNILGSLRAMFNIGKTDDLNVPHIGTFKVFCDDWSEDVHGNDRSGVLVEMKFIEDAPDFQLNTTASVDLPQLVELADQFEILSAPFKNSLFDAINNLAVSLSALFDQPQLYSSLLVAKIESFTQLIRHTGGQVKDLVQPENFELREALIRLHDGALDVTNDLLQRGDLLREFTVPLPMTVSQVAAAVYGDYSRGGEIMQLNILPDPLRIEAGTVVNYYKADRP